jgi:hypothetical protein
MYKASRLESPHHPWVNPFMRSEDNSVSGMVVSVVHSASRVDLSRLDSRASQIKTKFDN